MSIKVHHHPLHPPRAVAVCDTCRSEDAAERRLHFGGIETYEVPGNWKKHLVKKPGDKHWTEQHVCSKHHG